jgi:hypothetical protein
MRTLLLPIFILFLQSCGTPTILSRSAIETHNLEHGIIENIQFFNSSDIVLSRVSEEQATSFAKNGTLTTSKSGNIEQVVIRANTPGKVVKHLGDGKVAVQFDADPNSFLVFGPDPGTGNYTLQATKWANGRGLIPYGSSSFMTNQGAERCQLIFRMKRKYERTTKTTFAKGQKV